MCRLWLQSHKSETFYLARLQRIEFFHVLAGVNLDRVTPQRYEKDINSMISKFGLKIVAEV